MACIARTFTRSARFAPLTSLANNTAVPRNIITPLFQRSFAQSAVTMANPNLTTLDVCRRCPYLGQLKYQQ